MKIPCSISRAEWVTGSLAVVVLGLTLSASPGDSLSLKQKQTKAISNCRQIITAVRIYSADHAGEHPTGSTANEAFRALFRETIVEVEDIFGCPDSMFKPDGVIGKAPDFADAVKPGENHWAMTADLTDSSSNSIPLVYENPVKAAWPAKWITPAEEAKSKGAAWIDGTVIVGLNDSSVRLMKLLPGKGSPMGLELDPKTGKDIFDPSAPQTILDVELAKKGP
ncbi:hypothetical protein [Roseimicrobium gellanilyticum]|nr:hypothetical protein [Roseimicrobium gellanilyticum]